MNDSFDWVTARLRTMPESAFEELRDHCQKMVDVRKESLERINAPFTLELKQSEDLRTFSVTRSPAENTYGSIYHVEVRQSVTESYIRIYDQSAHRRLDATPCMTKKGNLRFKIDGCGSYKLWQVARKALEPLLFER